MEALLLTGSLVQLGPLSVTMMAPGSPLAGITVTTWPDS